MRPSIDDALWAKFLEKYGRVPCKVCNGTGLTLGTPEQALWNAIEQAAEDPMTDGPNHTPPQSGPSDPALIPKASDKCPTCGEVNVFGSGDCPKCIKEKAGQQQDTVWICPRCGKTSEHGNQICETCNIAEARKNIRG